MLKRIMSVLLVLTMLLATAVTTLNVSAATATTTSYSIATWDGLLKTATTGTTTTEAVSSLNYYCTTGINTGVLLQLAGTGTGTVQSVLHENSTTDYYVKNSSSKLFRSRPGNKITSSAQIKNQSKPVVSFAYDIMIPIDDNSATSRTFTITFTNTNSATDSPSNFAINYSNNSFSVDSTNLGGIDPETVVTGTASYTPGNWVTVEVRAYYDATTTKLTYGAYVDDAQIFYGAGNIEYSAFRLYEALWEHGANITTNYDDITYSLLGEADKPVTFTVETPDPDPEPEPEPEVVITDLNVIDFDDLTTTATTNTLTVSSESLLTGAKNMVHSSSTNRNTDYVGESREGNGMALVVTTNTTVIDETDLSKDAVMVHQPKRHFAGYVNEDGEEYIISSSYEIYVPEASKEAQRKHTFSFSGRDNTNADFSLASYIENEKLNFDLQILSEYAEITDFTERTKTADLPCDVWNTITYVMKIKYDTTNAQYDINLYGMYADECYYECSFKLDLSYANGLCMVIQGLTITGLDDKAVVTKYDNIKISSYSAMPEIAYAWTDSENYIYPLALNAVEGGVEAKAKILGNYENLCLVTAVYNANGKLEKLWTDTTLEDGYLSYTVTGSDYIKAGYKVKAFLFDSITSLVPYVENVGLVIE